MPAVLAALEADGISVASVTVAAAVAGRRLPAATPAARSRTPTTGGRARDRRSRDAGYMTGRELRSLLRQPWWIAITLVQPVIWLLLFGALFKKVAEIPGFGRRRPTSSS